jgi:hypothetical protein
MDSVCGICVAAAHQFENDEAGTGARYLAKRAPRLYYHAYQETFKRCKRKAARAGGWRPWLFRGFVGSARYLAKRAPNKPTE